MQWGLTLQELLQNWVRLCSMKGWSLECLRWAQLTVKFGKRTIPWEFIMAEIAGILENYFGTGYGLTMQPHESAVYLPPLCVKPCWASGVIAF